MSKQINCSRCGHKLFEKDGEVKGYIIFKCQLCGCVLRINLETERVAKVKIYLKAIDKDTRYHQQI